MLDPRIAGLRDIGAALNTSGFQVLRWASTARPRRPLTKRYSDPLRLRSVHGVLVIRRSRLEAWRSRNQRDGIGEKRVYGWADICQHVGMRRSAAVVACGWETDPLPVVRPEGKRVWAYVSALTEWCEAHEHAYGVHRLVSEARRLAVGAQEPKRWRKFGKGQEMRSEESRTTETTRVKVARVPGDYYSQDENAASSIALPQPVSRKLRPLLSVSRHYDESGIQRAGTR
jgi:hypothetical protein